MEDVEHVKILTGTYCSTGNLFFKMTKGQQTCVVVGPHENGVQTKAEQNPHLVYLIATTLKPKTNTKLKMCERKKRKINKCKLSYRITTRLAI